MFTELPFRSKEYYGIKTERIGAGGYASVYKYKCDKDGTCYAVKKFLSDDNGVRADALREISILVKLHHPNIIKIIDVMNFRPKGNRQILMVMEIADVSLATYQTRVTSMDPTIIQSYMYQLSRGLQYLHSHDVWHRDIKPHNILVYRNGKVVIADFGLSRFGVIETSRLTMDIQTLFFRAPEILLGSTVYGSQVDIFSLGVVFAGMILNRFMFLGENNDDVLKKQITILGHMSEKSWQGVSGMRNYTDSIKKLTEDNETGTFNIVFKEHIDRIGEDGIQLLRRMLTPNPNNRATMNEIMESAYFGSIGKIIDQSLPAPEIMSNVCADVIQKGTVDPVPLVLSGNIQPHMIEIIYDWLNDVGVKFKLTRETIFYTRRLIDLYLKHRPEYGSESDTGLTEIHTSTLQLIGVTAMLIASKVFEVYGTEIRDYVYITDKSSSHSQIIDTELSILRVLKFKLMFPNMMEYIKYYTRGLSPGTHHNVIWLCLAINIAPEIIDTNEVVQTCVYIAVLCSNDILPDCVTFSDKEKASILMEQLLAMNKKYKGTVVPWVRLKDLFGNWETCKNKDVSDSNIEIPSVESDKETTIPDIIEPTTVYKLQRNISVKRAEDEDISREDLGNFVKKFIAVNAVKAANMFQSNQPKLIKDFANYFKFTQTNDNVYRLSDSYILPNKIEVSIGPMTIGTTTTITFNHVPTKLVPLFELYEGLLRSSYFEDGKLGANITE